MILIQKVLTQKIYFQKIWLYSFIFKWHFCIISNKGKRLLHIKIDIIYKVTDWSVEV